MFSKVFKSKKGENSAKKDKEVSLVVENYPKEETFVAKVSRSLLVKHSPVFKKMSESGAFKKSKQVKLKGVTAMGLQKTIEYLETGSVFFLTHFEVIETLKVSHIYQVSAVNDICTDFLTTVIDRDNVCDIYEFATSYAFHQVEYNCLQFLDRRAEEVLKSPGFMTLKRPTVESILKRQSLAVESEAIIFRTVLTWGLNDCMRRGVDSENFEEVFKSVRPLLAHVRFAAMSEQEMSDPEVARIFKLLCTAEETTGAKNRRSSILRTDSVSTKRSSTSSDSLSSCLNQLQPRQHVSNYVYELDTLDWDTHSVRSGETFCLSIELLKGRVYLTGISLAFGRFVNSKGNCCLYLALSAVDAKSGEQLASARGAFMISEEEAAMKFPSPLVVRDSETVDLILSVKRAINICSMLVKDESQIVLCGDRKDVAMKIVPFPVGSGRSTVRSMVKGIKYFY